MKAKYSFLKILTVIGLLLCMPITAQADESLNKNYGSTTATRIDNTVNPKPFPSVPQAAIGAARIPTNAAPNNAEYSRAGSTKTITAYNLTAPAVSSASVTLRCGTTAALGNWDIQTMSGNCWNRHSKCYPTKQPVETCVTTEENKLDYGGATDNVGAAAGFVDLSFSFSSRCFGTTATNKNVDIINPTSASGNVLNSAFCIFNYVNPVGVSGVTGDDMFRISPIAAAFFEYKKLSFGDPDRLIYINRNNPSALDIMMPSGPEPGFTDYKQFVNTTIENGLTSVEKACFPGTVQICGDPVYPPVCGRYADTDAASGGSPNAACDAQEFQNKMGNNNNGCYSGTVGAGAPVIANQRFNWSCTQGALTVQCAGDISPGTCGSAAGGTYNTAPTSGLCACGQKASGVSQNGDKWVWTCRNPLNNQSRSCQANVCQPRSGTFHIQANCAGRNNYPNCSGHCNCVQGLYGGTNSYYGGVLCCGRGTNQAGFTTQGGSDCDCLYRCK